MALKFKKSHNGCAALLLLALAVPGLLSLREDRPQDTGSSGVSGGASGLSGVSGASGSSGLSGSSGSPGPGSG